MDNYPSAADPIPDIGIVNAQHHELVTFLTNNSDMRQAAKSSLKQAAYSGVAALGGGFLLGPVGGLVGGIAGSIIGFVKSDDYDGAVLAVLKLEESEKRVLMTNVGHVLIAAGAGATQLATSDGFQNALVELASQRVVREDIWNSCVQSLHH